MRSIEDKKSGERKLHFHQKMGQITRFGSRLAHSGTIRGQPTNCCAEGANLVPNLRFGHPSSLLGRAQERIGPDIGPFWPARAQELTKGGFFLEKSWICFFFVSASETLLAAIGALLECSNRQAQFWPRTELVLCRLCATGRSYPPANVTLASKKKLHSTQNRNKSTIFSLLHFSAMLF